MRVFRRFLLAVTAVTSLPLADLHFDPYALSGLSKYLPSVGLLIGTLLCAVASLLTLAVHASPLSCGILLAIAWLLLSGGIHFDGLMDTADGLFSHQPPERMLEIMRDSRVGNFGVMTGVCALLIKCGGLTHLADSNVMVLLASIVLIPTWSRWCEAYAIGRFNYLRDQGLGKVWHDTTLFPNDVLTATAVPVLASVFSCFLVGIQTTAVITAATIASGLVAAYHLNSALRGHTGDTYGAVVELSEAGALLILMLLRSQS